MRLLHSIKLSLFKLSLFKLSLFKLSLFKLNPLKMMLAVLLVSAPLMADDGPTKKNEPASASADRLTKSGSDSSLGRRVPSIVLPDVQGKQVSLADFAESKCLVVVFMGTACPIGNAYVPDLVDLQNRYRDKQVQVIGINSNLADSPQEVAQHAKEYGINFPVLVDSDQLAADLFAAERTPQAFVLDRRRVIRYRGRIDDRVGYDFKREQAKRADVEEAVKELLAGEKVSLAETELQGCLITRSASLKEKGKITFAKHVAKILQDRCANCHHPGTAAPFSLLTYEDAQHWSEMIKETVLERRMPPWNIDPRYGKFSNDLRMSKEEIDTLVAWIDSGSPFGDKKDLPPRKEFADGWTIGKPDLVLKMPHEYTVKARGTVAYQYFVTPTNFKQDMWVQASEARPGNRAVVHHIIAYFRKKNTLRKRNLSSIGGYAPGEEPQLFPLGVGKKLPAGSEIVWQVHYTPTGKVEKDRSELGLIFCKEPPQREAHGGGAFNFTFKIPAGAENHRVVSRSRPFSKDSELLSLMPHMHLRGKAFRYTAKYPDGREEILLNVPDYDFNWQHRYLFQEPKRMPKGTVLECVAHYDNSSQNPANPDPTKSVRWGDQTWEEMMIGFYAHIDARPKQAASAAKSDQQTDKPVGKQSGKQSGKRQDAGEKQAGQESQDGKVASSPQGKADKKDEGQKTTAADPKKAETSANGEEKEESSELQLGKILRRTYDFKEAGKEMEYALYLPKSFDAAKRFPLIVALHGLYSNPRQILGYPGFTRHADQHGYVLVAPMGYNNRGWYGSRGPGGGRGSSPKNLGELSEKDVMNVLELVRKQFKIDDDRIYLLGHSMGGGGSFHLASRYPKIWAAIAPIAPAVRRDTSSLERAKHIPVIVVQGDKDRLTPVTGARRWVEKMKELGMDHRYIEVKGGDHVFVAFRHFDQIFDFFATRSRKSRAAKKEEESAKAKTLQTTSP